MAQTDGKGVHFVMGDGVSNPYAKLLSKDNTY